MVRGTIRPSSPSLRTAPSRHRHPVGRRLRSAAASMVNSMFSADVRYKKYFVSAGSTQVKPDPVVSPSGQSVPRAVRLRRSQSQRLERGVLDRLRFSAGRPGIRHRAGDLQHRLLRLQRGIPAVQLWRPRRHHVPLRVLDRQYRHIRQSEEAGTAVLVALAVLPPVPFPLTTEPALQDRLPEQRHISRAWASAALQVPLFQSWPS